MAEFEEKLQAILSDPQAMGQIASLAQALTGGAEGDAAPEADRPPEPEGPETVTLTYKSPLSTIFFVNYSIAYFLNT